MTSMGSTCSTHRQHQHHNHDPFSCRRRGGGDVGNRSLEGNNSSSRRSLRHSVVCAIPDKSIANLYPVEDNYVNVKNGTRRSPKSLTELCVDSLCRSLPYLNGELPPGLPPDVVNDVVESLLQHSALNATTLRVLKNCELGALSLAGCRGVTDEWLEPLAATNSSSSSTMNDVEYSESMDLDDEDNNNKPASDIFYGTFESAPHKLHDADDESRSTSSFVSASSTPFVGLRGDHPMDALELPATPTSMSSDHKQSTSNNSMLRRSSTLGSSSVTNKMTLLDLRGSQGLTDRGLMQLANLNRLEVAKLDNCHSLTGRGLLALSHSHQLHTLSLANCRRLTDEAVINIAHLMSLESLSLDGCRCLTDRSLAALADLYGLRRLDLSQCDLITDEGLEQLEHLEALEELSLGWCRQITDAGIKNLTSHPDRDRNMRILRLARCQITDEGVEHIARLKVLEELDLNGCSSVGSAALGTTLEKLEYLTVLDVSYCPGIIRSGWQGKIRALKTLELCYSSVKDSHLSKFMNLSALEELNLDSCPVGDNSLAHLADHNVVPNLKSLDLADTNLTDTGMVKIAKFTNLTRLSLFYCNITNRGLRHIAALTNLEILNLDSRDISDDGLSHLRNLSKLRSLDVFSGRVTDSGCALIAKIESLESLELCGGGVGDLGCTLLANLDNLTSLNLSQNERITNRGAAALATLSNLKALNLSNTRVNSSALRFFSGLLKLQSLALYGCRGIEDERVIDKTICSLPNLKCLRLNTASDEDGMVVADSSDDESEADFWASDRAMEEDTSFYSDRD